MTKITTHAPVSVVPSWLAYHPDRNHYIFTYLSTVEVLELRTWVEEADEVQLAWEVTPRRGVPLDVRGMTPECFHASTGIEVDWNTRLTPWFRVRESGGRWSDWWGV